MKFAPPVDTDPNVVAPLKIDTVIEVPPVTKAPTKVGCSAASVRVAN